MQSLCNFLHFTLLLPNAVACLGNLTDNQYLGAFTGELLQKRSN